MKKKIVIGVRGKGVVVWFTAGDTWRLLTASQARRYAAQLMESAARAELSASEPTPAATPADQVKGGSGG